jgi:hypothetical protein
MAFDLFCHAKSDSRTLLYVLSKETIYTNFISFILNIVDIVHSTSTYAR